MRTFTFVLVLVLVLIRNHTASLINPGTWLNYLYPTNSADDQRAFKDLKSRINYYEVSYASHLTEQRKPAKGGIPNTYSQHLIRKVADTLTCSYYSPHSFVSLETVCKNVRFHQRHFLSLKASSEIIILTFRGVARVDSQLRHALHIFERAELLLPQVEEALRKTRARKVIYAGRGSGGAVASLLAFRLSHVKPTSVITLDEYPIYSDVLKSLHPVSPTRYLSFLTEQSDKARKSDPEYKGFTFAPSQIINLPFIGVDVLFEPEPEAINPKYFLPEGLKASERVSTKVHADLMNAIKSTHAAAKKMPLAYLLERENLQQTKSLQIIHKLESDLNTHLPSPKKNVRFRCLLRSPQTHSFQVLCEYGSVGYPVIEFLGRMNNVGGKKDACSWLTSHAVPFESEQAAAELKDNRHLSSCFKTLFSPKKTPFLRYFLFHPKHCHYYDFGDGTGTGAYLIPLGTPQLLVELMEKVPTVLYSFIQTDTINIPRECAGVLPPILSTTKLTPLKRLAAEFIKERTKVDSAESSLFDPTLTHTKSFKTTHAHLPKKLHNAQLPEHYYFKLSLCLSSDLMPWFDCTDAINQWAGYCPEVCLGPSVEPLCKNVVRCEGAGLYATIAPTGYLRGLKREMMELRRQIEDQVNPFPLFGIYEVQSLKRNYAKLYSQFYLSLIQIEEPDYLSSSSSSSSSSSTNGSSSKTKATTATSSSESKEEEYFEFNVRKPKSRKPHS